MDDGINGADYFFSIKKKILFMVVGVMILLIIGVILLIVFKSGSDDVLNDEDVTYNLDFEIFFCKDVDKDYNCVEEISSVNRGESFYVLVHVKDLEPKDNFVYGSQDLEVYFENELVYKIEEPIIGKYEINDENRVTINGKDHTYERINFKNFIESESSDSLGNYDFKVKIIDENYGIVKEKVRGLEFR